MGLCIGILALVAGAGPARAGVNITNTAYATCLNRAGLAQPVVMATTTFTVTPGSVVVVPVGTPVRLVMVISDETGRLIRTVEDHQVAAAVRLLRIGDGSGQLVPAPGQPILIALSDGTTASWDGRDTAGGPAPNGIYVIRVTATVPGGQPVVTSATFTLARPYGTLIVRAVLVPNPADQVAWLSLTLASTFAAVHMKIYDITGVLVFAADIPGTARSFRWPLRDADGAHFGDGLYVVVVEAYDPTTGDRQRVIRKLAVTHQHR